MLLEAYGSYGYIIYPKFSESQLTLLDRGFIYGIAHVRGGQDKGRKWYEEGKLLKKKNTFMDFISCSKHLITTNYTSKDKLIIRGVSAGGLLIGAVINIQPGLFKAAIMEVPFLDILNTISDPSLPLSSIDYEEWGNPQSKKNYNYIKSYAPYENIKRQAYPNILITTGINDTRVPYWESAKFVAKLRALKTDNNYLMLKTYLTAGHSGPSGRYEKIQKRAFEYAFLINLVGAFD